MYIKKKIFKGYYIEKKTGIAKLQKVIVLLCLLSLMVCACNMSNGGNANTQNEMISRDKNTYPKVDGSTANIPMMAQIRSSYLGEDLETAENHIDVSTTDYAWRKLCDKEADLVLAYEPSNETKEYIEKSENKLKIVPIGVDALVFITNSNNPINDISSTELQKIYEGKITNWKEIGGEDKVIEAFQRPFNSGSQTLFLNLVMKGKEPIVKEKRYIPYGMVDLIDTVASYKNTSNSIGYTVYYYVDKMYGNEDLKLLSVDGVYPNDDTISSYEYPFINEYYMAIRSDENDDSEAKKLFDYVISDKGKNDIIKSKYIPSKNNDEIKLEIKYDYNNEDIYD